jgi:hypothetical protein
MTRQFKRSQTRHWTYSQVLTNLDPSSNSMDAGRIHQLETPELSVHHAPMASCSPLAMSWSDSPVADLLANLITEGDAGENVVKHCYDAICSNSLFWFSVDTDLSNGYYGIWLWYWKQLGGDSQCRGCHGMACQTRSNFETTTNLDSSSGKNKRKQKETFGSGYHSQDIPTSISLPIVSSPDGSTLAHIYIQYRFGLVHPPSLNHTVVLYFDAPCFIVVGPNLL